MSQDNRTAQQKLTPEERRELLRAFADRMLLKVSAMDDPADMPGVEKAVRVVAVIERIYYRCDRAEHHTPDPRKAEADRATHESAAIKARVALATDLEWGEQRRTQLGKWWDAAQTAVQDPPRPSGQPLTTPVPAATMPAKIPEAPQTLSETPVPQNSSAAPRPPSSFVDTPDTVPDTPEIPDDPDVIDDTDRILQARRDLGLPDIPPNQFEAYG